MHTLKQFQPLVIDVFERWTYELPRHHHTYFEIIYIDWGKGMHCLNDVNIPYQSGDLFLLAPEDQHYFEIEQQTRFVFIKFTDDYFLTGKHDSLQERAASEATRLIRHRLLKEQKLVFEDPQTSILRRTIENIVAYRQRPNLSDSALIFYQILSLLGLVRERLTQLDTRLQSPAREQLISYVHEHIYWPEKLQVKAIASHFNIAPSYFSGYFKRTFLSSYRCYVNTYRVTMIEKRLSYSQSTLKQIAHEFGFTDESHLSNFFKAQRKLSPAHYRRQQNRTQERVDALHV